MSICFASALIILANGNGMLLPAVQDDGLLKELYQAVESVSRKHYAQVTTHQFENRVHFEYHTRLYVLPAFVKVPRGQQPPLVEERGPLPDGVYCDIYYHAGTYRGPRNEGKADRGSFDEYFMVPSSEEKDCYLEVILRLPNGDDAEIPTGFLESFEETMKGFEVYFPN